MKTLCLALLFTILVVSVTARPKRCRKAEDCGENECCIDKGFFRGAECSPLAKEGQRCNDEEDLFSKIGSRYVRHCPCEKHLFCEPEDKTEGIFVQVKINQRCVSETTTRGPTTAPPEPPCDTKVVTVVETSDPSVD